MKSAIVYYRSKHGEVGQIVASLEKGTWKRLVELTSEEIGKEYIITGIDKLDGV